MTPERKQGIERQQKEERTWVDRMIERFDEMEREKAEPKQERHSEKQDGMER